MSGSKPSPTQVETGDGSWSGCSDILAWNDLSSALVFAEFPERNRNYIRLVFTNPRMRALYPEWA